MMLSLFLISSCLLCNMMPTNNNKRRSYSMSINDGDIMTTTTTTTRRLISYEAYTLSLLLQQGKISAVQLMEETLQQIDEINPLVNAIICLRDKDELLLEAQKVDEYYASSSINNNDVEKKKGWLYGIPIAIKDLSNTAGIPSTMGGSSLYMRNKDNNRINDDTDDDGKDTGTNQFIMPQPIDDMFVRRIKEAGAIVIGKTNAPELGLGSHTYNNVFGRTINPYSIPTTTAVATDFTTSSAATINEPSSSSSSVPSPSIGAKSSGGSSGGAAVALSCRMLCIADGSDMMGSLRNPAGWNNIYSLRPTAGMITDQDVNDNSSNDDNNNPIDINPLPYPISTVGPMARSPHDLALFLETLAGSDKFSASSVSNILDRLTSTTLKISSSSSSSTPSTTTEKRKIRIGWLADWDRAYPMEDGILSTCEKSLRVLEEINDNNDSETYDGTDKNVNVDIEVIKVDKVPFPADKLWDSWTTIRSKLISHKLISEFGIERILGGGTSGENDDDNNGVANNIKPEGIWEVQRGLEITDEQFQEATDIALEWSRVVSTLLEGGTENNDKTQQYYDALALPSAQLWPFPVEWDYPKSILTLSEQSNKTMMMKEMDTYHRWMEVVVPCTLAGLPCVTIPAGFGRRDRDDSDDDNNTNNLFPIGIQIFSKRGNDAFLLSLASFYHQKVDWPSKYPPKIIL